MTHKERRMASDLQIRQSQYRGDIGLLAMSVKNLFTMISKSKMDDSRKVYWSMTIGTLNESLTNQIKESWEVDKAAILYERLMTKSNSKPKYEEIPF